jgi:hypothetical protein
VERYLYYLKCPVTQEPRYVGKTSLTLFHRLKIHFNEYRTHLRKGKLLTHKENWFRQLEAVNLLDKIEIVLIETCTESEVNHREIYWIAEYRKKYGTKLTNISEGGDGVTFTEEVCRKIGEKNRGEKNGMFGKRFKLSPARIENQRRAMINSTKFQTSRKSQEFREKISELQRQPVFLLNAQRQVIQKFQSLSQVAKYFGCTYCNVKHARKDNRPIKRGLGGNLFFVIYEKDFSA